MTARPDWSPMATNLVNLDALLVREDFESLEPGVLASQSPQRAVYLRLPDLAPTGISREALRKPDFQRETAYWTARAVAEFVHSFVSGDFVPSIIGWRNPITGNIFVIDGAHRLSALIAWVEDDYGDGVRSLAFFSNLVPPEQLEAAAKTRSEVKRLVGSYKASQAAAKNPDTSRQDLVLVGRNADLFPIPILWVPGDAGKAEESFYKINQRAVAIDQTELKIIKSRKAPSALAARAIIRGGVGHPYWQKFPELTQQLIREQAKAIFDILFVPPMPKQPIETLELPIAGRSYSGGDSLGLVFDFVGVANDAVSVKTPKLAKTTIVPLDASVAPGATKSKGRDATTDDPDGSETIRWLKQARRLAQRISGKHASSLGVHPAVYFYGVTGRYQPTAFLAIAGLFQKFDRDKKFQWFTSHRATFEEFLLKHRYITNEIVNIKGGRLKSYEALMEYYSMVLAAIAEGLPSDEIVKRIYGGATIGATIGARFGAKREQNQEFTRANKTVAYLRKALDSAIPCSKCGARIGPRSISYDHDVRIQDGGTRDPENANLMHQYCNTGYKESQHAEDLTAAE